MVEALAGTSLLRSLFVSDTSVLSYLFFFLVGDALDGDARDGDNLDGDLDGDALEKLVVNPSSLVVGAKIDEGFVAKSADSVSLDLKIDVGCSIGSNSGGGTSAAVLNIELGGGGALKIEPGASGAFVPKIDPVASVAFVPKIDP